jgi:ABC-2 type transport system ATP-binding protein
MGVNMRNCFLFNTISLLMNILEIKSVHKYYGNYHAVNDVSFDMPKGSILGLLGPNGAGKTSLIRIITTITRADKGEVFFDGELLSANHPSQIGYMPEERGLYKKMKVGEHLQYLAVLKGMRPEVAKADIKQWMEKFEIESWYNKRIEELSKGMQQKIQFIATVLHKPKLLILDEPFSGLDPLNANLIKDEIRALNQEGISVIFSTHRMEQVEEICEYMVLINQGRKVLDGRVHAIKEQYKENVFEVQFSGELLDDIRVDLQMLNESSSFIRFHVQDLRMANQVLDRMIQSGVVIREFREILPSINEIFINTVQDTKAKVVAV